MTALEEIVKWVNEKIPKWQGDAVRRLLLSEDLSTKDTDELYLLMKKHFNLISCRYFLKMDKYGYGHYFYYRII